MNWSIKKTYKGSYKWPAVVIVGVEGTIMNKSAILNSVSKSVRVEIKFNSWWLGKAIIKMNGYVKWESL